jgi:uncharacterized membrane protein SpoIIM required for sporulation
MRPWMAGRLKLFFIMLVVLIVVVNVGAAQPQSLGQAESTIRAIRARFPEPGALQIFLNNFGVALLMLIPGLGVVLSLLSMYITGTVIGALGVLQGAPWYLLTLGLMLTPFFWLEFTAYALASTQSIFLVASPFQKKFRREVKYTIPVTMLAAALLFFGAIIETFMIETMKLWKPSF